MREILSASRAYSLLAFIYSWFGRQWRESRIISAFLRPSGGEAWSDSSIFAKLWRFIHKVCCTVFEKLRLTKLLEGSIFKKSFIWVGPAVALAPLVPTMALLALAAAAAVSVFLDFSCDRERKLNFAPINRYILIFAFIYFVTTLTSVTPAGSLEGGILTVFFVLFAVILQNAVTTRRRLDFLLYIIVASGAVVAAYGLYQYFFGSVIGGAWVDEDMFSGISTRVFSTLQNPNVLAEYLLLVTPVAFAAAITAREMRYKLLFLACTGVMIVCMILTYSRGGWLGLIAAAALFLVILDRRFIVLGIAGLIGLYFILPDTVVSRFTSIGDMKDTSTAYRMSIWMGTISMLRHYWVCGIGPGTAAFNKVYPIYSYNSATAQHSHNLFLQIICDAGICGIIIFLIIIFKYVKMMASAISRESDRRSKILQNGVLCSVCGFLVQAMTDNAFYNYRVMFMFWIFIGLGVLLAKRTSLPEKELRN